MKYVKPKQYLKIEGEFYQFDSEDKSIKVGTILFDLRKEAFVELESKQDLKEYSYVAPEEYVLLNKIELEDI